VAYLVLQKKEVQGQVVHLKRIFFREKRRRKMGPSCEKMFFVVLIADISGTLFKRPTYMDLCIERVHINVGNACEKNNIYLFVLT
jgi:hypothetical protein